VNPETTTGAAPPTAEPRQETSKRPAASGSLYRVVWRWHFYAGVLVAPVLLVVAVTGALYVFRAEIEDYLHARLRFVAPGPHRLKAQALVDAARAAHPGQTPAGLELPADPRRSAAVRFGGPRREGGVTAYVDPYRGRVLGSAGDGVTDGPAAFFDAVLLIHRQLFIGTTGRVVVELTVGWTVVLLITGLYLWWPKRPAQTLGVWRPRWRAKPYTVLRDLHSVFGFYLLAPAFVIVVTGLFYSLVWGEAFYLATHGATGGAASKSVAPRAEKAAPEDAPEGPTLSLDRVEELARARYPDRNLSIALADKPGRGVEVRAGNDFNNSYGPYVSAQFEIDRVDGTVRSHKTLAEDDRYWWHGWVYPLHVGSVWGPATKVVWLLACLVLAALPVTGLWMWLVRRPSGRTGFPRRPERPLPLGLLASIVALGMLLPVVGASMILIVTGEYLVSLTRRAEGFS